MPAERLHVPFWLVQALLPLPMRGSCNPAQLLQD